jgi:alpha-mannosidase
MSAPAKRTAHYVVSTHWDREWYETFQDYRFRLVNLLDEVLDLMAADERFAYWQSDGQVILIEDYLEIRPERRGQIEQFARAGRLRIGPWFVLPDEFLSSGEALVRNLQLGLETASQFGTPSRVGFVCDLFGQTSQLPQILRGFSIDNVFLWRGTSESKHGAIWRWQSPDGSEVIAYRFSPKGGYCSYAFGVRKGILPDEPFNLDAAATGLAELIEFEKGRCPTPSFLLFDGGDHMEIEPRTTELLARMNAQLADVEIVHSHLDGFVEDLREQRDKITKVFTGELRDPGEVGDDVWVIPGVLSSRIPLKQANARCENELCLWAEPFSAFAEGAGRPYPHQYLHVAWRHLIANHPHDSACGCSIDQVHKDMEYRFDQARLISEHLTRDALRHIALQAKRPELGEKDFAVVLFNATADDVDGPVDFTLRFPAEGSPQFHEFFGFENKLGFRLYDADGNEVPYQYGSQRRDQVGYRRVLRKFPVGDMRHEVDVTAPVRIGPYGYTTLVCKPMPGPTRHLGSMLVDDHTIENERLRVSVRPNGTLSLTDKRTKQTYDDLLTFEDRADIGDGWYHGVAVNDQVFSSAGAAAGVALVADGIAKATLKVAVTMDVPREFRFDRMTRSEPSRPLRITSYVTLRKGSECVEVRTVVENTVRDHRLRVLLPTGTTAMTYSADGAYDVIERPIALRADNARLKEMEVETKPQYTWTAVCDSGQGGRGLAVVSTGLPESAVRNLPNRPIALTLLRSFRRTVFTNGEEGGQIQGTHEFAYSIVPLDSNAVLPRTRLCRLGQQLAAPPRWVQVEPRDIAGITPALPASHSFLSVSPGNAVVTAVQQQKGVEGVVVRMFNPTEQAIEESITLPHQIHSAERIDLEGTSKEAIKPAGSQLKVRLGAKQIVTVRIQ